MVEPDTTSHEYFKSVLSFVQPFKRGQETDTIVEVVKEWAQDDFDAFGKVWTHHKDGRRDGNRTKLWAGAKRAIENERRWIKNNCKYPVEIALTATDFRVEINPGTFRDELDTSPIYDQLHYSVDAVFIFTDEQDSLMFQLALC